MARRPASTIVACDDLIGAHWSCVVSEMVIDGHDHDECGEARTDRIAGQARDAGEAAACGAVAARRRGESARERLAELREWGGQSPGRSRETADRAANAAAAAHAAGKRASEACKRAATAHANAADAHDRAAAAAERAGDMTRAIEHRRAAARDRIAASADLSGSQQTTAACSGYGSVCDAGNESHGERVSR
jgi:hypothetical protein